MRRAPYSGCGSAESRSAGTRNSTKGNGNGERHEFHEFARIRLRLTSARQARFRSECLRPGKGAGLLWLSQFTLYRVTNLVTHGFSTWAGAGKGGRAER